MGGNRRTEADRFSRSVGLLISMLVRYPEIGAIRYVPERETLRLSFMLSGGLSEPETEALLARLKESLHVISFLGQRQLQTAEVQAERHAGITVLEVTRDVASLTKDEVALIVGLLREMHSARLVVDENASLVEEEAAVQEELIAEMLADLKEARDVKNLIAFREEGRVMVFNK